MTKFANVTNTSKVKRGGKKMSSDRGSEVANAQEHLNQGLEWLGGKTLYHLLNMLVAIEVVCNDSTYGAVVPEG